MFFPVLFNLDSCLINEGILKKNILKEEIENIEPELLFRYCKKQCSTAEQEMIEQAMSCSEELRLKVKQIERTLEIAADIEECESIDVFSGYKTTRRKIRDSQKRLFIHLLTRYAAILTFPLLLSSIILGYLYFNRQPQALQFAEVTTPTGAIVRYELPDKSVVWLNSGTKLRYPVHFSGDKREVELTGEAYFEVQADKKHPFYVNTPNGMSVYVYGTQFDVNAYEDESTIEVVLEKGKVNVIVPDKETVVRLEPGEQLQYEKSTNRLNKMKVDVYEKMGWKYGKLIFRNASLSEMFKRLARHYNVDIQFNNISGKEYNYRATFTNESLIQILDYLSKSTNLKWAIEEPVQKSDGTLTRKKIIVNQY